MGFYFQLPVLFLILTLRLTSQDIIIKNDSSRLEVKIIDVTTSEVKYKRFNFLDGPLYITNKAEISYVIYLNGIIDVFTNFSDPVKVQTDTSYIFINAIPPKGSTKSVVNLNDYIKFNIEFGTVISSSYCNLIKQKEGESGGHGPSEIYSSKNKKNTINLNIGFNLVFGNHPFIKPIIGVNYLRSKGEFDYSSSSVGYGTAGGYLYYSENYHYNSEIDFLNILTGLRFTVFKGFHIAQYISLNQILSSSVKITGTESSYVGYNFPTSNTPNQEIITYNNADAKDKQIHTTFSFCPKIAYDFNIKQEKVGVYVSYNACFFYRLPWWMFGVTWYPFKKLR